MQTTLIAATALLSLVSALPTEFKRATAKPAPQLPSSCLKGANGAGIGWLPDDDYQFTPMLTITNKLKGPACYYGVFMQFDSDTSVSNLKNKGILTTTLNDIKKSGAIAVLSVQPLNFPLGLVTSDVASRLAEIIKRYTDEGITVYVRFAHEFNFYTQHGEYIGGPSEFKAAWAKMAAAVASNPKAYMFWCPNTDSVSNLKQWFPDDPNTVDVVGVDAYKFDESTTFTSAFEDIHDYFAAGKNKPFVVGETGAKVESWKKGWLSQMVYTKGLTHFQGFSWFEYNKPSEGDYRVVTGATNYAAQIGI